MYNEKDGFIRVSKKHKRRQESKISSKDQSNCKANHITKTISYESSGDESRSDDQNEQLTDQQLEKIIKFYDTKASKFKETRYFQLFSKLFKDALKGRTKFEQVICYGLGIIDLILLDCLSLINFSNLQSINYIGNFNKQTISRTQLYFFICLRKLIKCDDWQIYDPIFNQDEKLILKKLNLKLIEEDEECRRCVENKFSLFYMPHCCKFMFNNLFWSNWNVKSLKNLNVIGNSLNLMCEGMLEKDDLKSYSYVHSLKKMNFVNEYPIENIYLNSNLFNDLSFHTFDTTKINESDLLKYYKNKRPIYRLDDKKNRKSDVG